MVARSTRTRAGAARPEPGAITAAEIALDRHRRLAQLGWLAAVLAAVVGLGVWAAAMAQGSAPARPFAAPPPAAPDEAPPPLGDELIGGEPAGGGQPVAVQHLQQPSSASVPPTGAPLSSVPGVVTHQPGSPSAPPTTARPGLAVSSALTPAGLAQRIDIIVSNHTENRQIWRSVGVQLTGVSLLVSDVDPTVTHTVRSGVHCFAASAPVQSIPAGASASFSFRVTNLGLGGLGTVTLDPQVCLD